MTETGNQFKAGDRVYLKSGSPRMVIISINGENCRCIWIMYGSDRLNDAEIPALALRLA